ncbi:MAG: UvrD-helicase domain-containing protein [Clostridiales bacterium]|nr:UvrD-helicase domain-containing protein [Clostridiales bacterium]
MFLADLHIHSRYSRATSKECVPEYWELWARRKGIALIGTGDFTHPAWREELQEKLAPAEEGLYVLKEEYRLRDDTAPWEQRPRFLVTGEISSIYKRGGKTRKVHNLFLLPGLDEAERFARRLEEVGNLHSDGRPILGIDSRDLLELALETDPQTELVPAHIWTPHFSMFGAFSDFSTVEECFGDLTPQIHALETGLSSDPPMNWRLSQLDRYALISNSDAHSPARLGREANLFGCELSYPALKQALAGEDGGLVGTLEFFPEEGKYHFDGHRNCGVCLNPAETAGDGRCPICGKKLTIGVLHRVEELADREEGIAPPHARQFESLVPLPEVIAASTGAAAAGKKVQACYEEMLRELGDEFHILRQTPPEDIERIAGPCIAEGIRRMRQGRVERCPGFDGEYGRIQLLSEGEIRELSGQLSLYAAGPAPKKRAIASADGKRPVQKRTKTTAKTEKEAVFGLNEQQRQAVTAEEAAVAVVAGPGTGKTGTLVARILHLIREKGMSPGQLAAVTFTNKAAAEMRERLTKELSAGTVRKMRIGTFHSLCLRLLSEAGEEFALIGENEAHAAAEDLIREQGWTIRPGALLREISRIKNAAPGTEETGTTLPEGAFEQYNRRLQEDGVLDYDDLLLRVLEREEALGESAPPRFSALLVDEFQDINEIQYRLVRAWSGSGGELFVIGDPDQSIYGFRGSDARCFDRLQEDYPGHRLIRLTRNYRSTPEIVDCALPLIDHNPLVQGRRVLEAQRSAGEPVRLLTAADDFAEALFIAKEINRLVGGMDMLEARLGDRPVRGFSDIAVLYRTHRQAEVLERCLRIESIPYTVAGRDRTLNDPVVRGIAAFFRSLMEPRDRLFLRLCLRTLFHCTGNVVNNILLQMEKTGPEVVWERLSDTVEENQGLLQWKKEAEAFRHRVQSDSPDGLLRELAAHMELEETPSLERLFSIAVLHADMPSLLQTLTLGAEGDVIRSGSRTCRADTVSLMTLHAAKGLEFPVVFLCGINRGTLPLEMPGRAADREEERRLFYVGLTRAREELILLTSGEPSDFLEELPPNLLRGETREQRQPYGGKQLSLFD